MNIKLILNLIIYRNNIHLIIMMVISFSTLNLHILLKLDLCYIILIKFLLKCLLLMDPYFIMVILI